MRARTIREGSVGLLILFGIGLFGGLILWLRGFNPNNRPYKLVAKFAAATGIQIGTSVMYRGVPVGRVLTINPLSNSVELELEITQKDLRIPAQVTVETLETGLIGETSVNITPLVELSASAANISPTGSDCNSSVILCNGDRLDGQIGPSYEELLRSAGEVANLLNDPELIEQLKTVLKTATSTTKQAGTLATEATELAKAARSEIVPLAKSAQAATSSADRAAQQVEGAATQFSMTAADVNRLIGENRGVLVNTLDNLEATSVQLRGTVDALGPTIQGGDLVGNLETLVKNAAAASSDLQAITSSFNTPANLVLLQQTLESARDALASAQKVLADVDEITGDPAIREQLRELINGLSSLVSSTQSLDQQSEVARILEPLGSPSGKPLSKPPSKPLSKPLGKPSNSPAVAEAQFGDRPVLVFDGDRYVILQTDRFAEKASSSPSK